MKKQAFAIFYAVAYLLAWIDKKGIEAEDIDGNLKLVDGSGAHEGRVEIFFNGNWSTATDDGWDYREATVVCNQLGYPSYSTYSCCALFGEGTGPIAMDNVACYGSENSLLDCSYSVPSSSDYHNEDVSVICNKNIRLSGSSDMHKGRVEIYLDSQWGTVSATDWDMDDADVVCRQLGYPGGATDSHCCAKFGEGSGPILANNVACTGSEQSLQDCSLNTKTIGLSHSNDAGVTCNNTAGGVRLVNGHVLWQGRVEVSLDGEWGTVSQDGFGFSEAVVVCNQLGYPSIYNYHYGAKFGEGNGAVLMDNLRCSGSESSLLFCPYSPPSSYDTHSKDVGVVCNQKIRLSGSSVLHSGRVEVYLNGGWGTVSDEGWDLQDSDVVCRQLGYAGAISSHCCAELGTGSGTILLNNVECSGTEETIQDCAYSTNTSGKSHSEDAGVTCDVRVGGVRLVDGNIPRQGRVEVLINGEWGTVSDYGWSLYEAQVVCNQLGYPGYFKYYINAQFGEGNGSVLMDDLLCSGTEASLHYCIYSTPSSPDTHSHDAGVTCNQKVRLSGSSEPHRGRVEVYLNGRWGTVSDEGWDLQDSDVVCRQLGYAGAISSHCCAEFGAGSGTILLNNVECSGTEETIQDCDYSTNTLGKSHSEDAGVTCRAPQGEVRLVNGGKPHQGRVEINFGGGEWSTICDDNWDMYDANVVCNQLGFPGSLNYYFMAQFGQGSGPILMSFVQCTGYESTIFACPYTPASSYSDSHSEDAGVTCNKKVRLSGGSGIHEGRVEVYTGGMWGTVSDNGWDFNDAETVCRELGYPGALESCCCAEFGQGSGPVFMDDVDCMGTELSIFDCAFNHDTNGNSHSQDAGVICNNTYTGGVKLVDGVLPSHGRVEVYSSNSWGTSTSDGWSYKESDVICKQLGYPGYQTYFPSATFGEGSGQIALDQVLCTGLESSILYCDALQPTSTDSHSKDIGLSCERKVRLVGGSGYHEGRIEVYIDGQWGTVKNDAGWDLVNANVVCRQLGFPGAIDCCAEFSEGTSVPISIHSVECTGSEKSIQDCSFETDTLELYHSSDAAIICNNTVVQLVDGNGPHEGRVEVFFNGEWGSITDTGWDYNDATVICNQLGFPSYESYSCCSSFGQGTGPMWIDLLGCGYSNEHFLSCPFSSSSSNIHSHSEDAGLVCNKNIRLIGGATYNEGRVEVYLNKEWGTVAAGDNSWGFDEAEVVCKQLGFPGASQCCAKFGEGSGKILMHDVDCTGNETMLQQCNFNSSTTGISHSQDAGVICKTKNIVRLVGGSGSHEGRVEVYYSGSWGTVCDDSWSINDAKVVCRELGFSEALSALGSAYFGQGSGVIWLDEVYCDGTESSIEKCIHNGWGVHNCGHSEDASVICDAE